MATFQVSHPVVLVILMIANDVALHLAPAEYLSVHQRGRGACLPRNYTSYTIHGVCEVIFAYDVG
jgi:hypothetical protein